jgi:hypothetical protein
MRASGDKKVPEVLMAGYISELLVLCRAALRLFTPEVPRAKLDCAKELAKHASFDAEIFAIADALRRGEKLPGDPEELFGRFLKAVESLCEASDSWSAAQK